MDLERINEQLAQRDFCVMQQSNGRYALYHIERGAARVPGHAEAYDRYVRASRSSYSVIPAWMFEPERGYSAADIDRLMQLRERAFPKTANKSGRAKR
jgi:hypothetical protein